MTQDSVQELFAKDKLLARAMDTPGLEKKGDQYASDFSIWAVEVDTAKNEGLTALSTTLLVPDEKIPTYKNIGFLINSDSAEVFHIADSDSGSGWGKNGFVATKTDISSLSELAEKTRNEGLRDMNEVNINVGPDAYVGLFANKAPSDKPKAHILLAQEYYKQQTGKTLPIYIYDSDNGTLTSFNPDEKEKTDFIAKMCEEKKLRSSTICYKTDEEEKYFDYLDKPAQEKAKTPPIAERIKYLRDNLSKSEAGAEESKAPGKTNQVASKNIIQTKFQEKRANG